MSTKPACSTVILVLVLCGCPGRDPFVAPLPPDAMPDAPVPDASLPDAVDSDATATDATQLDAPSAPDATPPPDTAPPPDAIPPDAATMGQLLITWTFTHDGHPDPTCADLHGNTMRVDLPSALFGLEAPCTDGMLLSPPLPPQTFMTTRVVLLDASPTGGGPSRVLLQSNNPVTIVAGSITTVNLELHLFDEPEPQMQSMCAAAAAFYAAAPDPKHFPPTPAISTEPALGACCLTGDLICLPEPLYWTDPSWVDLGFSITTPSRYSYQFTSNNVGPAATFQIRAFADYDCDALYRSYTINGSVAADGTIVGCDTIIVDDLE